MYDGEVWREALAAVPPRWHAEFGRFVREGEAGPGFLAFLEADEACRRACETLLRRDALGRLLESAKGDNP